MAYRKNCCSISSCRGSYSRVSSMSAVWNGRGAACGYYVVKRNWHYTCKRLISVEFRLSEEQIPRFIDFLAIKHYNFNIYMLGIILLKRKKHGLRG